MDGVGEWATASIGVGRGNDIEILDELHCPDSLGLLYSAFTYYTGFKVNSGEYKVMGLAPYGEPKYVDLIYKELIDLTRGRLVPAEPEVLQLPHRPDDDQRRVRRAVRRPAARSPRSKLTQREMDLARSVQVVSEEIMLRMARTAHQRTGCRRTSAWPAASRSTASATAACCARGRSSDSGFSRRPATPAARSASRSSFTIGSTRQAAASWCPGSDAMQGVLPRARVLARRDRDAS